MQLDSWGEMLGPEFFPFSILCSILFPYFHPYFVVEYLSFSNKQAYNISSINHYLLFHFMLGFIYNHGIYLLLCWYVHPLKERFRITSGTTATVHYIQVVRLQQLALFGRWSRFASATCSNDAVNVNVEIISDAASCLQLKLPKNLSQFIGHVSLRNNSK